MKWHITFVSAALFLFSSFSSTAQSRDEQGLTIPDTTQLPQDKEELIKAKNGWWTERQKNYAERMAWYEDAKFGCFIHWGVYSVPAGIWNGKPFDGYSEHLMRKAQIPLKEYKEKLVYTFNPVDFNADEWMRNVSEAGMKYFIITSKHHDGFAMFPSDAYPYDIHLTKLGRDPMQELREAAKKYGIKFGFYYSHAFDWEHPDAPGNDWDYDNPGGDKRLGGANWWLGDRKDFLPKAEKYVAEKSIPQIKELIAKYDPDILWFDTPSKLPLYLNIRIMEAINEADPEGKIVMNGRLVRFGSDQNMGDYKNTGDRAAFFPRTEGAWESIPTTNESYGYSVVDTLRKKASFFVQLLASAASKGGNILMNIGPMGNGKMDERDIRLLQQIGVWMNVNGESIYGTERTNLPIQPWGVTTCKGDTLYAHVFNWPKNRKLLIGGLHSSIEKAWLVKDGTPIKEFRKKGNDNMQLKVPKNAPDPWSSVIAIVLKDKQDPNPVRLLEAKGENMLYTFDADLQGDGLGYGDGKVNRNYVKNWKNTEQSMKWDVRLGKRAKYDIFLNYNTADKEDTGSVIVEIDGRDYAVAYPAFTEKEGQNSIPICRVKLKKGLHTFILKGKDHEGEQFMNPIAIKLEK